MDPLVILTLAIAIDMVAGDPPTALHPVGWIGRIVSLLERCAPRRSRVAQLAYGGMIVAIATAASGGLCYLLLTAVAGWNHWAYLLCAALLLKSTFAVRGLLRAAGVVRRRLDEDDFAGARRALRALVSRDTTKLGRQQLAAAAVESVAENTVDSFVAPVFFFVLFAPAGPVAVAAALAYRAVNTCDSMIGYHGRYEYLGKAAARLDDLLNWIPARLGAMCLIAAAAVQADAGNAWRVMSQFHDRTESPNAGWTMSAAAGALGITIEKVEHYRLGDGRAAGAADIDRTCRLTLTAVLIFAVVCAIILLATAQGG